MVYIYEGHLGGLYVANDYIEDTYCEQCGDSDTLLWQGHNEYELGKVLRDNMDVFGLGGYDLDYLNDIYNEAVEVLNNG